MGKILWAGREIELDVEVVRDQTRWFDPSDAGCGTRGPAPRLFVAHWTGGEQTSDGIYDTLVERELSVEFAMDMDGTIHQFADPGKTFCAHAHGVNTVAFGMEIQCRGTVPGAFTPAQLRKLDQKFPRGVYQETYHGQTWSIASFTLDQVSAFCDFCESLVNAKLIPRQVYGDPRKRMPHLEVLSLPKLRAMQGVIGHLNVSPEKEDPGSQLFAELIDDGWKVVAP